MEISIHPGILFGSAIVMFVITHIVLKWSLPLVFVAISVVTAFLGGFFFPFRHIVEGGFGFLNLVLLVFAGAFFGQMMKASGAAERGGSGIVRISGGRTLPVLILTAAPLFGVGMFVGISGVAVLAAGVFAVPALKRIGFDNARCAAFIAVVSTAGMIAPPINVPAMLLANGVNMPWSGVTPSLLALSLPLLVAAIGWFTWTHRGVTQPSESEGAAANGNAEIWPLYPLALVLLIWVTVRLLGEIVIDPASPLILVVGALAAIPMLPKFGEIKNSIMGTFSGTPLFLAAVLVTVGIIVQIMTLTGVRGWLVINVVSLEPPVNYLSILLGIPLIGGALTAMVASDIVGVPAAFSFVGQQMILNVVSLSSIATLSEFVPPTAISAVLSCYVVGDVSIGQVIRKAWPPMAVLAALAMLMLIAAPFLSGSGLLP